MRNRKTAFKSHGKSGKDVCESISIECEDQLERLMSIQISNISLHRPVKGGQN